MNRKEILEEIKQKEAQVSILNESIKSLRTELEEARKNETLEDIQFGNVFCLPHSDMTKLIVAEAIADVAGTDKRFVFLCKYGETFSAWSLSLTYGHSGPYTKQELADYIIANGWVLWGKASATYTKIR